MRKLFFIIAVILLITVLSACSGISSSINQAGAGMKTEEKQKIEKYNSYVMLNNLMTGRINEVLLHYFEKFGTEKKPVIEKNLSFIMLDVPASQQEVIDQAQGYTTSKPAFTNVDSSVTQLTPVIKDLLTVLDEMKVYYDSKGYVDDNFAKGKQLHTKLIDVNLTYEKASKEYFKALQKMDAEQRLADLKNFKDSGQQIRYNALKFMIDAEATAIEMSEQGINASNVLKLDMKKFKAKYDLMTADLDALVTLSKDQKQIQKEGINSFTIENYVHSATEAKAAASKIIERINKKEPVSDSDLSGQFLDTTDGTPENFNYLLSKAIERYNEIN